jgi:hypothetical protein
MEQDPDQDKKQREQLSWHFDQVRGPIAQNEKSDEKRTFKSKDRVRHRLFVVVI